MNVHHSAKGALNKAGKTSVFNKSIRMNERMNIHLWRIKILPHQRLHAHSAFCPLMLLQAKTLVIVTNNTAQTKALEYRN